MNDLLVKVISAGIAFGIWPIFMSKSGLKGSPSAAMFAGLAFLGVLTPALLTNGLVIPVANWTMIIFAGVFGAFGLWSFNTALAVAPKENTGTLIVVMTVVQAAVAGLYQIWMNGCSISKGIGYLLALAGVYLILK